MATPKAQSQQTRDFNWYTTLVILLYVIPLIVVTVFYWQAASTDIVNFLDPLLFLIYWIGLVALPPILTVGVFVLYRNTYNQRPLAPVGLKPAKATGPAGSTAAADEALRPQPKVTDHQRQWERVYNKALDWRRFILPLCFFNLFATVTMIFFASLELWYDGQPLPIPTAAFYFGFLGFTVYFLEMSRRRYISRNIVPHFYMSSSFRFLYVTIIVPVFYIFMQTFGIIDLGGDNFALLASFIVGMFPLQLLTPVVERVRTRLGMNNPTELPVTLIRGVNNTIESILQEENIDSVQALAISDPYEIQMRTAVPLDVIMEWQRQAQLFHILGSEELIRRFARIGINDFEDLALLADIVDQQQTGDADTLTATFIENFKTSMQSGDDEATISNPAYWDVLLQVVAREYRTGGGLSDTVAIALTVEPPPLEELEDATEPSIEVIPATTSS